MKVLLTDNGIKPTRAHEQDAGLDLYSPVYVDLMPMGGRAVIDTGVHIQLAPGTVGFVKGRSSLNSKGIIVAEGTIDEGYTGSIGVVLINTSREVYHIEAYDRIAQLVVQDVRHPSVRIVDSLDKTERGENGFGSSGL